MLYNFGIYLYGFFIKSVAIFHPKAKKWVEGRRNMWDNLPDVKGKTVVWFHCASLGEYDQGKPIIETWKNKEPNHFILVTFFSPSGYENIKNKSLSDYTCYLPLDTPKNAQRFIRHFQPSVSFFVKYEIWINHLRYAKESGSKLYLVSAVFSENQRFFKWYGKGFRKVLSGFDFIFVQNRASLDLLTKIGVNQALISGDTRYDRVIQRTQNKQGNEVLSSWTDKEFVLVVGSSWPKDESVILPYINSGQLNAKVILAPHEVDEKHIQDIEKELKVPYQLYTDIQKGEALRPETHVLILNCIGVLADAYQYGDIAYVGGGFGTGLHNILEPAAFGLPVIFGPDHKKFPEASEFIASGIGKSCESPETFIEAYQEFLKCPEVQQKASDFIADRCGATEKVIQKIFS